jgi:hypothetical protein
VTDAVAVAPAGRFPSVHLVAAQDPRLGSIPTVVRPGRFAARTTALAAAGPAFVTDTA